MAKYTDDFKLQIINHYLNGHGYKQTAQTFGINHKQVETWVKLYQIHGVDGILNKPQNNTPIPLLSSQIWANNF